MRILLPLAMSLAIAMTAPVFDTKADDLDVLKERAAVLKREAAELRAQGQLEAAERVQRHAKEVMTDLQRRVAEKTGKAPIAEGERQQEAKSGARMAHALKEQLQDARAALQKAEANGASEDQRHALREKIGRLELQLAGVAKHLERRSELEIPPQFRAQAEKLAHASRRIHHLHVAAENLKAAEMPDMAQELMKKSESLERDVVEAKERLAREIQSTRQLESRERHPEGELHELRAQNERLRQELRELRELVERLREKLGRG
jgi:hypothetical protein